MSDDYLNAIRDEEEGTVIPDSWGDSQFDLVEDANGIRRFKNSTIQGYIDEAIRRRNPDKDFIAIAHGEATGAGKEAYISLACRINDQFSIAAGAFKKWGQRPDKGFGGEVIWER